MTTQTRAQLRNKEIEILFWEWYDNIIQSAWGTSDLKELNDLAVRRAAILGVPLPKDRLAGLKRILDD